MEIVQIIQAAPGHQAVIVNQQTGKPEFHPVILWGLACDEEESTEMAEDQYLVSCTQAVLPLVVSRNPAHRGTLIPADLVPGYIGIAGANELPSQWEKLALEWKQSQVAVGSEVGKPPTDYKWN